MLNNRIMPTKYIVVRRYCSIGYNLVCFFKTRIFKEMVSDCTLLFVARLNFFIIPNLMGWSP
jgi:hypothetical protein